MHRGKNTLFNLHPRFQFGSAAKNGPAFSSDFTSGTSPASLAFTRSSAANYWNSSGVRTAVTNNQPRYDYDPISLQPRGLLMEGQRTNFLLNSLAPVTQTVVILATGTFTAWMEGSGSITTAAGTAIGAGFGVATNSALGTYGSYNTFTISTVGTVTVTVNGTVTAFQLEDGAFASSMITTTGATATRALELDYASSIPWYNQTEGTFVVEYMPGQNSTNGIMSRVDDGTDNTGYSLTHRITGTQENFLGRQAGVSQINILLTPMPALYDVAIMAAAYKSGSNSAIVTAGSIGTSAYAGVIGPMSGFRVGSRSGDSWMFGWIRKISYYNTRMTDTQLQIYAQPQNLTAPQIAVTSGGGYVNSVYSITNTGLWANKSGYTFTYQWFANGVAIPSATGTTYTMTLANEGATITAQVTGTNGSFVQTVTSNALFYYTGADISSTILGDYDAFTLSSITKDGSNFISNVASVGSVSYPLASTTTLRPTYISDDGDGMPCISFLEGNQLKNVNNTTQSEDTFYLVCKMDTFAGTLDAVWGRGAVVNMTASSMDWSVGGSVDGVSALRSAPIPIKQQWIVFSGRRSSLANMYFGGVGNTGVIELFENGATLKATTHTSTATTGAMFMGQDNSGNTIVMKVRQARWYNGYHNDTQRLKIEEYLRARWNVYSNFAGRRDVHYSVQRYFTRTGLTSPSATIDLYGGSGQSNLGGQGQATVAGLPSTINGPITNANIWNPTSGAWETLQIAPAQNNLPNVASGGGFVYHGSELSWMYDTAHDLGPRYLIKSFEGGTGLRDRWMPNLPKTQNLWRIYIDTINAARTAIGYTSGVQLVPKIFVWYQGEQDATLAAGGDLDAVTGYQTREQTMLAAVRSTVINGAGIKFVSVKVRDVVEPSTYYDMVSASKVANASVIPNYQVIEGWTSQSPTGGPHGDSSSMIVIGNAIAIICGATTQV